MSDLIDEVEVDRVEEKKVKIFKKIIPIAIFITLLIVVFMFWRQYNQSQQLAHNREMTDMLVASLEAVSADSNAAMQGLDSIIDKGQTGMADLATLEKVKLLTKEGKQKDAMKLLNNLSASAKHEMSRSYAEILWLSLLSDANDYMQYKDELGKVVDNFKNRKDAFYPTAMILAATIYKSNNQPEQARELLEFVINAEHVSGIAKEEARAVLSQLN